MIDEKVRIEENIKINENFYLLRFSSKYISKSAKPGNFVMLRVSRYYDPILRRPFSIFYTDGKNVSIYYKVIGRGSKLLSEMRTGDEIDILGPLGNSFPEIEGKKVLLIAGGIGIVPIYFFISKFSSLNEISLAYGASNSKELNFISEIEGSGIKNLYLYTEDGSEGKKGFVTKDIKKIIEKQEIRYTFSCGPNMMMKTLFNEIGNTETFNFISLESYMGCGFGACQTCVVKTKNGYKKVCVDGPVFRMEDIEW